jgi:hypothetical protein
MNANSNLIKYDKSCEEYTICDALVRDKRTDKIEHCCYTYDYHWGGQAFHIYDLHEFVKCDSMKEEI